MPEKSRLQPMAFPVGDAIFSYLTCQQRIESYASLETDPAAPVLDERREQDRRSQQFPKAASRLRYVA